jgi:protein NrfC
MKRRDFLKVSGSFSIAAAVGQLNAGETQVSSSGYPLCQGYLLVDTKKCQGCSSCMLACSLAHEGQENMTLSRIQIIQNPFGHFPDDIEISQCRQCVDPECVANCPTEALFIDEKNGNIRTINLEECVGCQACVESCPHQPSRAIWNTQTQLAAKCDLCADTPYFSQKGGPSGKQACTMVCPVGAIKFSKSVPFQEGDVGYNVNLRGESWEKLGYPID